MEGAYIKEVYMKLITVVLGVAVVVALVVLILQDWRWHKRHPGANAELAQIDEDLHQQGR